MLWRPSQKLQNEGQPQFHLLVVISQSWLSLEILQLTMKHKFYAFEVKKSCPLSKKSLDIVFLSLSGFYLSEMPENS